MSGTVGPLAAVALLARGNYSSRLFVAMDWRCAGARDCWAVFDIAPEYAAVDLLHSSSLPACALQLPCHCQALLSPLHHQSMNAAWTHQQAATAVCMHPPSTCPPPPFLASLSAPYKQHKLNSTIKGGGQLYCNPDCGTAMQQPPSHKPLPQDML